MIVPDGILDALEGFDWDSGNSDKNWHRHGVRQIEAEQVLLNRPMVRLDANHSEQEARFMALGKTDPGRLLTVVFTVRANHIRVISARPMSRAERKTYAEAQARPEADS